MGVRGFKLSTLLKVATFLFTMEPPPPYGHLSNTVTSFVTTATFFGLAKCSQKPLLMRPPNNTANSHILKSQTLEYFITSRC